MTGFSETIAPGTDERDSWSGVLIWPRLLLAMQKLNPAAQATYLQQAVAEIAAPKWLAYLLIHTRRSTTSMAANLMPGKLRVHGPRGGSELNVSVEGRSF